MKKGTLIAMSIALVAAAVAVWNATRPTTVTTAEVDTRDVSEVYVVTGRVRSRTTSGIGSELAGRVSVVHVREGSKPRRAEPLVDLQPLDAKLSVQQSEANLEIAKRELERARRGPTTAQLGQASADIASARTDLRQAEKEFARAKELVKEGIGTTADRDRAENSVERAQARVALVKARKDELDDLPRASDIRVAQARLTAATTNVEQTKATLGKTTIIAPFDGLVLAVDASVGENVRPAETLITLVRTDDLEFFAEVDESYFGRLQVGQKATAVFFSNPELKYDATISQIGPDVDPNRGVLALHIEPKSLPEDVVPGLSADIAIELKRIENARSVPTDAIARDRGTYVLVVDQGIAKRVDVTIEADGEEYVAVSGLDDFDTVIRDIALIDEGEKIREGKQ